MCAEMLQYMAGEEVNSAPSQITPQQSTSVMPLTGQTGFLGAPSNVGQPQRAPSLPALHTQMLTASANSQAALNNMAARAAVLPTPGLHFARQVSECLLKDMRKAVLHQLWHRHLEGSYAQAMSGYCNTAHKVGTFRNT